jgi:hypothetical protein
MKNSKIKKKRLLGSIEKGALQQQGKRKSCENPSVTDPGSIPAEEVSETYDNAR